MTSKAIKLHKDGIFLLPPSVVGRSDVSRILREIEKVDYDLEAQAIRQPNQPLTLPNISRSLSEVMSVNNLSLDTLEHRKALLSELRKVKEHAPLTQITFAIDPNPDAVSSIVHWIRTNLHASALITIGMQPSLVGGCVVRTPDHIYDFSLRKMFKDHVSDLAAAIHSVKPAAPPKEEVKAGK
jgi:hypothetical protein